MPYLAKLEYNQETNWFYGYHNILQEEKIVKELKIFKSDDHFERTYGMLINLIYIKNDILSLYMIVLRPANTMYFASYVGWAWLLKLHQELLLMTEMDEFKEDAALWIYALQV